MSTRSVDLVSPETRGEPVLVEPAAVAPVDDDPVRKSSPEVLELAM